MNILIEKTSSAPAEMSSAEIEMAHAAQRCIMEALDRSRPATITLTTTDGKESPIELPPTSLRLIGQLLGLMSERRGFTLIPAKQEFSTVEAANFLNVSRPFIIKEIKADRLPHRMVGTHRRIAIEDLMKYAQEMRKRQEKALERMADNARELGLEY